MASPGNPNPNQQQRQPAFDVQKFFPSPPPPSPSATATSQNPTNQATFPIPPSSYPPPSSAFSYSPQTSPFHAYHHPQFHNLPQTPPFHYPHLPQTLPPFQHLHPHPQHHQDPLPSNMHQQRSLSYPTPTLNPSPPNSSSSSDGARIMALLGAPQTHLSGAELPPPLQPPLPPQTSPSSSAEFSAAASPMRMLSSKLPKGRHLGGDHAVYDIDVRLPGEVQPQLEVTPITKYGSDPQLVLGRQIAVNRYYICYGLKQGNIRVLNIHTALRSLFRAHTQVVFEF